MITGNTPTRSMRVVDDVWEPARESAAQAGLTMTDLVTALLEDYNDNGGQLFRDSDPAALAPAKKAKGGRTSRKAIHITDDDDGLRISTSTGLTETDAIGLLRSVLVVTESRFVQHMTATPTEE